jgi:hypothetical protein
MPGMTLAHARHAHAMLLRQIDNYDLEELLELPQPTPRNVINEMRLDLVEKVTDGSLTYEDIAKVFAARGMVMTEKAIKKYLLNPAVQPRALPKKPSFKIRGMKQYVFDNMLVELVEKLGVEQVDPRIVARYCELVGILPWGAYIDRAIDRVRRDLEGVRDQRLGIERPRRHAVV